MEYRTSSPSEDVTLFVGELQITIPGQGDAIAADGKVWFKWEPSPRPYFGINTNDPRLLFDRDEAEIVLPSEQISLKTSSISLGGARDFPVHGGVTNPSIGDVGPSLEYLIFHATNLRNFAGGPISFDLGKWEVSITPVAELESLIRQLRYEGGFGITHVGRIERKDRRKFAPADVEEILSFLYLPLSFARGIWTGPILPIGFDDADVVAWRSWRDWKLGRWRGMPTWFDDLIPNALADVAIAMWTHWQDSKWKRPLQTFVSSLVEADTTPSTEVHLLLIQTTLELLSWLLLVETKSVYKEKKFDKLSAADKIRALLDRYQVGHDIPQELSALRSLAANRGYKDGPDACTQLRNGLVHPHEKGRKRVETLGVSEKFEAAQLLHWYAEVVFLKELGYTGKYGNRLKLPRWSGDLEDLP